MIYIYDIETYNNFFSATFKNYETKEIKQFVIFKNHNDLLSLIDFITNPNLWLAGYNNYSFDNQILKYLYDNKKNFSTLSGDDLCYIIHTFALSIIEEDTRNYSYFLPFKSLDLMKIGGLYQKSLKLVGTVMKWPKLQDLPIPNDQDIKVEDVTTILKYNLNDVEITERLFELMEPAIQLRAEVSKEYDINAWSESDSGIANKLLEKFYSESTGLEPRDFKDLRTKRGKIFFQDVIMPDVFFRTDNMMEFLTKLRKSILFESTPFMKKSFILHGTKYVMGVGGLHSQDEGGLFEETEDVKIIDADVGSYYPTMIINNNIHPKHLGDSFIKQYKEIRDYRIDAKHKSKDQSLSEEERTKYKAIQEAFKIILNSSYGKMKYENHWLYDPLSALQITINCQLYLLMLIEYLGEQDFNVISANTDGIITLVPKDREEEYYKICKQWEEATQFTLEFVYYKKYARRDVNNYLSITVDGIIKAKGDFIYPDLSKINEDPFLLRRGFDRPIIPLALNKYFIEGIPIEDTIRNHKDIYDFCTSQKTDKKFINEYHTIKNDSLHVKKLQQSVRYYVSNSGGSLYKKRIEDGGMINYCVGYNVTIFNDYVEKEDYDINYNYYIKETQKIIDQVINPQLKLF